MSDQYWDDEQDEYEVPSNSGPKPLREALKAKERKEQELKAELDALKEQMAKLLEGQKKNTVKDLFTSKGLAPQVADLYQGEATPEAVEAWLGQYGTIFGAAAPVQPQTAATAQPGTVVTPEDQRALEKVAEATGSGGSPELIDKIKQADQFTDMASLTAYLQSLQG